MRFFRKRKRGGIQVSTDVTAMDGMVVARRGEVIDDGFLQRLARRPADTETGHPVLRDTEFYRYFEGLLDQEKYLFITNQGRKREHILQILAPIRLHPLLYQELQWMSRYAYHCHHGLVVALLVTRMMLDFFQDEARTRNAAACAIVHDIGITRVPEAVLNKIGTLDDAERAVLREHPLYSFLLLSYYYRNPDHPHARIAYEHHEDLLGSGYPRGIVQQDIVSQCIRLCDTYDALITARPFRAALSPQEAWEKIAQQTEEGLLDQSVFVLLNSYLSNLD